jgi:hypothetical protein
VRFYRWQVLLKNYFLPEISCLKYFYISLFLAYNFCMTVMNLHFFHVRYQAFWWELNLYKYSYLFSPVQFGSFVAEFRNPQEDSHLIFTYRLDVWLPCHLRWQENKFFLQNVVGKNLVLQKLPLSIVGFLTFEWSVVFVPCFFPLSNKTVRVSLFDFNIKLYPTE